MERNLCKSIEGERDAGKDLWIDKKRRSHLFE